MLIFVEVPDFDYLKIKIFRTEIYKKSCAIVMHDITTLYTSYDKNVQPESRKIRQKHGILRMKKSQYCSAKEPLLPHNGATMAM